MRKTARLLNYLLRHLYLQCSLANAPFLSVELYKILKKVIFFRQRVRMSFSDGEKEGGFIPFTHILVKDDYEHR